MNPLDLSEARFRSLAVRLGSLASDYHAQLPGIPGSSPAAREVSI